MIDRIFRRCGTEKPICRYYIELFAHAVLYIRGYYICMYVCISKLYRVFIIVGVNCVDGICNFNAHLAMDYKLICDCRGNVYTRFVFVYPELLKNSFYIKGKVKLDFANSSSYSSTGYKHCQLLKIYIHEKSDEMNPAPVFAINKHNLHSKLDIFSREYI